jgi:hypothetical protein
MQKFEVKRVNGVYRIEEVAGTIQKYGIVVLKGYIAQDTREEIRSILTQKLEDARSKGHVVRMGQYPKADFLLGDILTIHNLEKYDYIFFKQELVELAKKILKSDELVYYGDSSTQFDEAARGFHKDHVERTNANTADWVGEYGIIRCAFYCEDHDRYSGGLKVRLASHNVEACRSMFDPSKISHHAGKAVDVKSLYGDLVIWSMRLTHSGNYKRLTVLPWVCVHPRLEGHIPSALSMPEQQRRYFMSCALAKPGAHLEHYLKNMLKRDADYRMYLERARRAEEAESFLTKRSVTFRKPCDYYGRVDMTVQNPG